MMNTIRLDASSIQLLFPEGSEQRVEITNAVAAEITRKMFARDIEEKVTNTFMDLDKFVEKIEKHAMKLYGQDDRVMWPNSTNPLPTERLKIIIEQTVKTQLTHQVALIGGAAVTKRVAELVDAYMESGRLESIVNNRVEMFIEGKVKDMVRAKMSSINLAELMK